MSADIKADATAQRPVRSQETPEAAAAADMPTLLTVSIPVLGTAVPSQQGAELRHYLAPAVQRSRQAAAVTLARVAGRQA